MQVPGLVEAEVSPAPADIALLGLREGIASAPAPAGQVLVALIAVVVRTGPAPRAVIPCGRLRTRTFRMAVVHIGTSEGAVSEALSDG